VEIIVKRHENGKNYGVVLIPEGLVEFIPAMNVLISEINRIVVGIKSNNPE
jgi:6-phosphofructokinase